MIELLLFGFTVLLLASLHDMKTREVPDYLSYLFITAGIIIQAYSLLKDFDTNKLVLVVGNLGFATVFGLVMYYKKQWGGADSKLLIGLSLNLSGYANEWLFAHYFLNFLLVGALYGTVGSLIIILINLKKFAKIIKKDLIEKKDLYLISTGVTVSGLVLASVNPVIGVIAFIIGFITLVSLVFSKANLLMVKRISVKKLTEGDWVIDRVVAGGKVLFDPKREVDVKEKQIARIRAEGVKSVRVIEGMPFVPSFLIAYLVTILRPELFVELVKGVVF